MKAVLRVCKIFLKKDYGEHERTLISLYEGQVGKFTQEEFESKMDEFKRSVSQTPKGVKQRRAEGSENSRVVRLRAFLNKLFSVAGDEEQ